MIDLHVPPQVQPVLENYISLTKQNLPGLIAAFYIVGSIALDKFNERFSDIDSVAVLGREITSDEIERLRSIHQFIEQNHPGRRMSGSYIQADHLGKQNPLGPHLHFHDGIFHLQAQYGLNLITRWELKNHGITILGLEPQHLNLKVDWDLLLKEMNENMNSYWRSWAIDPRRIIVLYSDWGIPWAILGVLRQFYTFQESSITTKVRAARYALGCLPLRWHTLIQEAINIREDKKG